MITFLSIYLILGVLDFAFLSTNCEIREYIKVRPIAATLSCVFLYPLIFVALPFALLFKVMERFTK